MNVRFLVPLFALVAFSANLLGEDLKKSEILVAPSKRYKILNKALKQVSTPQEKIPKSPQQSPKPSFEGPAKIDVTPKKSTDEEKIAAYLEGFRGAFAKQKTGKTKSRDLGLLYYSEEPLRTGNLSFAIPPSASRQLPQMSMKGQLKAADCLSRFFKPATGWDSIPPKDRASQFKVPIQDEQFLREKFLRSYERGFHRGVANGYGRGEGTTQDHGIHVYPVERNQMDVRIQYDGHREGFQDGQEFAKLLWDQERVDGLGEPNLGLGLNSQPIRKRK